MDLYPIGQTFWWILAMIIIKESTCLKGPWITMPHIVKSGDTVALSCEYDTEKVDLYSVKLYRNYEEFFRYTPKDEPALKYFRIGNIDISQSGPNGVTLKNVTKEQSGTYECEVSTDAPWFETGIIRFTMNVIDVPSSDLTMKINHENVTIGTKLSAECFVPNSDPPANITWFMNDKQVSGSNSTLEISPHIYEKDGKPSGVSRKIEIVTSSADFLEGVLSLKCEANIYNIWKSSVERLVKNVVPSKVMGELTVRSTSSQQSQINDPDLGRNI